MIIIKKILIKKDNNELNKKDKFKTNNKDLNNIKYSKTEETKYI